MRYKLNSILLVVFALLYFSCSDDGGTDVNNDAAQFGPTAFSSFNEIEGLFAYNSESDAFHGVIVGASREVGKIGNALNFTNVEGAHVLFDICCFGDPDTGEGRVSVSFPDNSLTIAAWLNPTAMSMDAIYPIFGGSDYGVQSMKLRINNGKVEFLLYTENNGGAVSIITSMSTFP